jgi:hypothetical protein
VAEQMRWLIFFLIISTGAFAQQVVEGTIVEQGTGKPIPFASVIVVGTSQGTSSNGKGEFSISVSEPFSLRITSIGYESRDINSADEAKLIKLMPTATTLDVVVVSNKPIKPKTIVAKSLAKISENYSTEPFLQKFFYRHYCQDGEVYGRLIEASVDVWKNRGYRSFRKVAGDAEEIRITQLRRSLDKTRVAQGHEPISIKNILETDLVGYQVHDPSTMIEFYTNVSSLKADMDKYTFTFEGISNYDGQEVYDIGYQRKDSILESGDYKTRALVTGTLTITTENHAIIKREEVRTQGGDSVKTSTRYFKYNDRYYPYHFLVQGDSYNGESRVHSFHIELMSVDIRHDASEKFSGDVPGRKELLNIPYDSMFWTTNTVLKTTPLEDDIIADLGGGASLSEQFLLYRQYDANTTNLGKDGDKKFEWLREYSKDNRVLYLVFWSQDVGQYIVSIERLKQLHRQYRDEITFVFLSLVDDEATWNQLIQRYNLSADGILNYRIGSQSKLARTFSVRQAPEFVLIGKTGDVFDAHAKKPGDPNLVGDLETLIDKPE